MQQEQFAFDFDSEPLFENVALWTPRDIWVHLNQRLLEHLKEDRRIERKNPKNPSLDGLAAYYSTFSNTPDGGLLVYGIQDDGEVVGCNFSIDQLNSVERCHVTHCPLAKPEFKRVPVIVGGKQAFCLAIYVPYVGRLVETNKDEAWIRYGESKHLMSEQEKQDFRATRQELSFELTEAYAYEYPKDFDLRVIQDFCDMFRDREQRPEWSNQDILVDRHLAKLIGGQLKPLNSLVLMAALDPGLTIPGCRVRIQRFAYNEEGSGEKYSPLRDLFVEGNLVKLIQQAQEQIAAQIYDVTWLNKDGKFVTTPEYPQWAWLEALVNACVHRSYSFSGTEITVKLFPDRMEIESPGGFIPPVNEKTIYYTRASRNHYLMDALRYLGYVRMAREGTRRIRDTMQEYQLPEPLFQQENLHGVVVKVTLRNDQATRKRASERDVALHFGVDLWRKLEEHEIKIVAYAYRNETIQVSEAQRVTGRTWATSKKDLDRLAKKGLLIFEPGNYVRDPKAKYRIVKPTEKNEQSATRH
ncbi:ATP-binding protein [Herbaspirillum huttiense F1]|uniref:ATP-binding protein n=1 Tax=Herbaspirillum huttiense TaxID=863372 RepID=UPI002884369C|nr:ATP-binding protein [Herbaspirillum huttiense]MDT0355656.1 ATP-binding protein [Herbaspirillum huttiense F1]